MSSFSVAFPAIDPVNIPTVILKTLLRQGDDDFLDLVLFARAFLGAKAGAWADLAGDLARTGRPLPVVQQFHKVIVTKIAVAILQKPEQQLGWPSVFVRPFFDVDRSEIRAGDSAQVVVRWARLGSCHLEIDPLVTLDCPERASARLLAGPPPSPEALLIALRADRRNLHVVLALAARGHALLATLAPDDRALAVEEAGFWREQLIHARGNWKRFEDALRPHFGERFPSWNGKKVEAGVRKFLGPLYPVRIAERLAAWADWEQKLGLFVKGRLDEPPKSWLMNLDLKGNADRALADPTARTVTNRIIAKALADACGRAPRYRLTAADAERSFGENYQSPAHMALAFSHQVAHGPMRGELDLLPQLAFADRLVDLAGTRWAQTFLGEIGDGTANFPLPDE